MISSAVSTSRPMLRSGTYSSWSPPRIEMPASVAYGSSLRKKPLASAPAIGVPAPLVSSTLERERRLVRVLGQVGHGRHRDDAVATHDHDVLDVAVRAAGAVGAVDALTDRLREHVADVGVTAVGVVLVPLGEVVEQEQPGVDAVDVVGASDRGQHLGGSIGRRCWTLRGFAVETGCVGDVERVGAGGDGETVTGRERRTAGVASTRHMPGWRCDGRGGPGGRTAPRLTSPK